MALTDSIKIQITAEVAKALKNMGLVETKTDGMKKQNQSLFKQLRLGWIAIAGVVLGVSRAIGTAIAAAAEFEEANAKFGTVFRGVSKEANAMRKELVDAYGLSTTEATRFLASTQDLFVPLGVAREKAAGLSGEVVKLARDIASFNKLPTADVLRDIQSSMVGNFETTRKYGVVLSEATVKQRALEKGMKITNGKIGAQDRALVALELITQGSSDAMGDFKRTADSFSNTMVAIKAVSDDVSVAIGQTFITAIQPSTKAFKDFITSAEGMGVIKSLVIGLTATLAVLEAQLRLAFNVGKILFTTLINPLNLFKKATLDAAVDIGQAYADAYTRITEASTNTKDSIIADQDLIVESTEINNEALKVLNADLAQFIATSDAEKQAKKIADLEDLLVRTQAAQATDIAGEKSKAQIIKQLSETITKEKKKELDKQQADYKAAHEVQAVISQTFVDGFMGGIEDMKSGSKSILISMIKQFTSLIAGKLAARAAWYFTNPATIPLGIAAVAAAGTVKAAGGAVVGKIQSAAQGADFVTNGPQLLMVGDRPDGEEERVKVTKAGNDNSSSMNFYGGITVQANDPDEFIDQLEQRYENTGSRMFPR